MKRSPEKAEETKVRHKNTPTPWNFERTDLSIRARAWGKSNQMGDFRGNIICDFRSALGASENTLVSIESAKLARNHAVEEMKANAQFIVKAVNSYYPMLEALKEAKIVIESQNDDCCLKSVIEAINQAEGGQEEQAKD